MCVWGHVCEKREYRAGCVSSVHARTLMQLQRTMSRAGTSLLHLLITFDPDCLFEMSQQSVVELNSSQLEKVFQKCFEML